jgi:hypothetical protein
MNRSPVPVSVLNVPDQALSMLRAASPLARLPVTRQRNAFWYAAWMSLYSVP